MTTVDTVTGEIVVTYGDVKQSIEAAKSSLEKAAEQIIWQIENRAWEVLGYVDWNEMREAEYGGAAFMVPRAERPELVARMRGAGLTQQDIAATAGVSVGTVNGDLKLSSENEVAESPITNSRGQQRPATYTRSTPIYDVAADLAEFPDLTYFRETGRTSDVPQMADDLRRFRERGELDERLDTLRRSIAVDRAKRDGTYRPTPAPAPESHCPTCTCN